MIDYKKTILNLIGFVLVCAVVLLSIYAGIYFWPFLVAIIFALLLERSINYITKKTNMPRKIVGTILVIILYLLVGFIIFLIGASLVKETITIATKIPAGLEDIKEVYNNVYGKVDNFMKNLPQDIVTKIYDTGLKLIESLGSYALSLIEGVIAFVKFMPSILIYIIITFLATLFLVTDRRVIARLASDVLPSKMLKKISTVISTCLSTLGKYLRAQCIMICITFIELFIAFVILKIDFPLSLAVVVALVDALPILGTGTVLIPWAIYSAITGNLGFGLGLFITYIVILVVRQLVEPRIVSANLGVHPFITLLAMYIGFKIFGLIGMIIGPVCMIIFKNVFDIMFKTGYFKRLFVYKKTDKSNVVGATNTDTTTNSNKLK